MDEALGSGLLTEQGDLVGLRHLLAAQAVYDAMPFGHRQNLHARAAAAFEAVDAAPPGQLAHHLLRSGRLDEWVHVAEKAADQALALGHDVEAVRLLEDVLRNARLDAARRAHLAAKLGRAAMEAARCDDGIDLLAESLADDLPPPVRAELRFWLAMLLHQACKDPARQRQLFAEAVDELQDQPDLRAWAMVCLGLPVTPGVPLAENLVWLHRSLESLHAVTDPAFEIFLPGKVAMVLAMVGDPAWRELTDRIRQQTDDSPRHRVEVSAYQSVGIEVCLAGHHETADRLLTTGLRGAAGGFSRQPELYLRSAIAVLDYCSGSWDGLRKRSLFLVDELGDAPDYRIKAQAVAACLSLARGDLDDARDRLAEVIREAEVVGGSADVLPLPVAGILRLAIVHGEVEEALAGCGRLLAVLDSKEIWVPAVRALPALTQALVATGRVGEASQLLGRVAKELRSLDAPLAPAALRHAQGFLDAAAGSWPESAQQFLAAAELYDRLLCPYEQAQAHEQAAASHFVAGDDTWAEDHVRAAMAGYQRLGATWDLNRTMSFAREHQVSVPARHRGGRQGYGGQLSPREREIAELAAVGRTNKEIAQELFLSPRTVDTHLGAIRRKLGVRSRAAIARRLADTSSDAQSKTGSSQLRV